MRQLSKQIAELKRMMEARFDECMDEIAGLRRFMGRRNKAKYKV